MSQQVSAAPVRLEALADWVVCREAPRAEKTPGGRILLAHTEKQQRPTEVLVVAAGPGRLLEDGSRAAIPLAPGDRLLVPEYGVTVCEAGLEGLGLPAELRCYRYDQVLARLV